MFPWIRDVGYYIYRFGNWLAFDAPHWFAGHVWWARTKDWTEDNKPIMDEWYCNCGATKPYVEDE
jgi:hypothetical protein